MQYKEQSEQLEVPKGTGVDGFLHALREILELPRLQEIHIDGRGKITYKYFLREGEAPQALGLEFDSLMPYAVVRNGYIEEMLLTTSHPAVVLGQMFAKAAADHVYPVAWVGGAKSAFWAWFEKTMGAGRQDELYGLPFLRDRMIEDDVLILATAFGRRAPFIETQRSYKILLPRGE